MWIMIRNGLLNISKFKSFRLSYRLDKSILFVMDQSKTLKGSQY